ncbi:LOW QUALITY PROTEIN: ankyrin repeat and zinc finger domain-containing protein 1-like [Coregonus clupeaformis]|uniref:LOW QUALITY PROTEIN: ankyrin repeat and zinc finger domain-containing protein 1-like n=1 Tax=Coregonus clupeaformis TaxID=59861 RepID=UPI001E1C3F7C|nr:LOW QUALITY PROTEIN: ankyrin repeat and zinc finger domain-containing protein 1-like [Coregonus clupeaformis]
MSLLNTPRMHHTAMEWLYAPRRISRMTHSQRERAAWGEMCLTGWCARPASAPFDTREEQMEHYKLDWHRFNLRQRLVGRTPATVEEFERKTGVGDMSSISGSDSEQEEPDGDWAVGNAEAGPLQKDDSVLEEESFGRLSNRVVFQNSQGQYLAVYRCILQSKSAIKEDLVASLQFPSSIKEDLVASLQSLNNKTMWVILMAGGGHFAGAVFQGRDVLQHKTFHRYTVRAKRGTSQGLRDAKSSSHAPKSAGAALRRYNEAALVKEIQDLLESWSDHLTEASAIFLRAPSYNKSMFLWGKGAPLAKKDPRIRTLPFPTRRATFREVKRVHDVLSTLNVYGKDTEVSDILSPSTKVWKKARTPVAQPEPHQETTAPLVEEEGSSGEELELETVEVTLGTLDLREHEIYPARRRKRKEGRRTEDRGSGLSNREAAAASEDTNQERGGERNRGGGKPRGKKTAQHEDEEPDESWDYGLRDALYTACKTGDLDTLISLLPVRRGEQGGGKEEDQGDQAGQREDQGDQAGHREDQGDQAGHREDQDGQREDRGDQAGQREDQAGQREDQGDQAGQREDQDGQREDQGDQGEQGAKQEGEEKEKSCSSQDPAALSPLALLNQPIDSSGFTLLHVASAAGQKGVVQLLLGAGSNPACKDKKGQTPYIVAPDKDTRNMFRKYMADHPDKYNYSKAQVPGPLTAELESQKTEKKKAQKAAKKKREKEQKEERRRLEMEVEEKKRFASLSDREKRALAAEKRLADHKASTGGDLSNSRRCWQCGESLVGKVPFQYLDFSFCTPRCVQEHRKANVANWSKAGN